MPHVNVMAPLVVGNPADPDSESSQGYWKELDEHLKTVKEKGVYAVSTDVWWGLVEKSERQYDWRYYDKLSDHIIAAGLKWVPIISLHQCGGNIGDNEAYVPLPAWVWTKLAAKTTSKNADAVKYVSEQGHASSEFVSCWATDLVLDDYKALFAAFQAHFASKAEHIVEINVSLGPAGELRYPSYNSHDQDTGHPTRGALQCYSELARTSWIDWVLAKYGDREGVRAAWGTLDKIEPPVDVNAFFNNSVHTNSQYGKDLFDWYSDSLIAHGKKVLTAAIETFGSDGASFHGIDVGAKVPGVHWRMGHWENGKIVLTGRLAELDAGIIRTSDQSDWMSNSAGHGYAHIVRLFADLKQVRPTTRVVLHFTCLEMPDGQDAEKKAESLPQTLVQWVGAEARRQGVCIKGENALGWNLPNTHAWQLMRDALTVGGKGGAYEGLTLLRMHEVVTNWVAASELKTTIDLMSGSNVTPLPTGEGNDQQAA